MLKTIYCREPNDPNYNPDAIVNSNELEAFLMKIRMIFETSKGEVLGVPAFGLDIESLLFSFNVNEYSLKESIYNHLNTYISNTDLFNPKVNVKFFKGRNRDIVLIDIIINDTKYLGFEFK